MSRRRWALQPVWFGAFVFGLIGYLAAPLVAQSTSAGSSQAFSASGTSPFLRQPAAGGLPEPAVAAMAIVWFGNEIENAALEKLEAAAQPLQVLPGIVAILEDTRKKVAMIALTANCPWACQPGDCSPDCRTHPLRSYPASRATTPDRITARLRWETNALENTAIEVLARNPQAYASIREPLSKALEGIKQLK